MAKIRALASARLIGISQAISFEANVHGAAGARRRPRPCGVGQARGDSAGWDYITKRVQVLRGRVKSDGGGLFSVSSVLWLCVSVVFYNMWTITLLHGAMHETALRQFGAGTTKAKQSRRTTVPRRRLEPQEMSTDTHILDRDRSARVRVTEDVKLQQPAIRFSSKKVLPHTQALKQCIASTVNQ